MDLGDLCIVAAASFVLMTAIGATISQRRPRLRRRWQVRSINRGRYDQRGQFKYFLAMKRQDQDEFFKYTRMDRATYEILLRKVQHLLIKKTVRAIPADMKLALTLQYLSQGSSLQQLAWAFQIGHTTVWQIVGEVLDAIIATLKGECLPCPTQDDWINVADGFQSRWGVPNCLGAIDGKHITIQAPNESGSMFFNYKRTFSIVLMALVDHDYNFSVVDIGAYGSEADSGVFASTVFGQIILTDTISSRFGIPDGRCVEGAGELPFFIVGDDAFPLKRNLMKPFAGQNLPEKKAIYNYRISRGRRIVENAFGILASRFRIFRGHILASPESAEKLTLAAVILHNFIRSKIVEKYIPPGFADAEEADGSVIPGNFRQDANNLQSCIPFGSRNAKKQAFEVREKLADYFVSDEGSLPGQVAYVRRGKLNC